MPLTVGQCRTDAATGVSKAAWDAFLARLSWSGVVESIKDPAPNPARDAIAAILEAASAAAVDAVNTGGGGGGPGGVLLTPVSKLANFTATVGEHYRCNAIAGQISVQLPSAAALAGKILCVKKIDGSANKVRVLPDGGDLIDSSALLDLTGRNDAALMIAHSSGWDLI